MDHSFAQHPHHDTAGGDDMYVMTVVHGKYGRTVMVLPKHLFAPLPPLTRRLFE